ncbi:unnamed protein product [Pleuronectes platessa]|uniref:Uncharacterized protein n=1 Tax=Pleuronectes platessa TaxID=8262 RepID=A0A9N7Z253_PLEPL|nr:unnamed protein product [Pleuronectes platessa]
MTGDLRVTPGGRATAGSARVSQRLLYIVSLNSRPDIPSSRRPGAHATAADLTLEEKERQTDGQADGQTDKSPMRTRGDQAFSARAPALWDHLPELPVGWSRDAAVKETRGSQLPPPLPSTASAPLPLDISIRCV